MCIFDRLRIIKYLFQRQIRQITNDKCQLTKKMILKTNLSADSKLCEKLVLSIPILFMDIVKVTLVMIL